MRRVLVLMLLLCLVAGPWVAPALGQEQPPQRLGAPVQTVVDAVPRVVASAIAEARRDGSPDAAEALVAEMRDFVSGFDAGVVWPEGSAAAAWPVNDWLRYAVDVVDVAAAVPRQVAHVERVEARCAAWSANATAAEVQAWGRDVRRAELLVSGLVRAFDDLVAAVPPVVDAGPLVSARADLRSWQDATAPRTVDCVVRAEADRGLDAPSVLSVRVVPDRVWPYRALRVFGGVSGMGGSVVSVQADAIGLHRNVTTRDDGSFQFVHVVPGDARLGSVDVVVAVGDLVANASLDVVRIPTRLVGAGPPEVDPFGDVPLRVRVVAVDGPEVPDGPVAAVGTNVTVLLANGTAELSVPAPLTTGPWSVEVRYAGTSRFAPSARTFTFVSSVAETSLVAAVGPDEEATRFDRTTLLWAGGLLVVLLLVSFVVPRLVRRRAPPAGVAWGTDAPPPLPASGPLVRLFALFYAWAVRLGVASRSDTPREMAAKVGDPRVVQGAREFERVRYGGGVERPERSAQVGAWLRGAWSRLVGR